MIIILTGKSCSGKDSVSRVLENMGYRSIVSWSSRPKRENETNGIEYNFCSKTEFENMIRNNEMIEYRFYNTLYNNVADTWYYGIRKETLDTNKNYIVILDLNGAKNFINYYGKENCMLFYLDASYEIRKRRAINRGSFDITEWERRALADDDDFEMRKIKNLFRLYNGKYIINDTNNIKDIAKIAELINVWR